MAMQSEIQAVLSFIYKEYLEDVEFKMSLEGWVGSCIYIIPSR
jgi:hypothetical protein